ncbi:MULTISPECIES: phage tail protein [Lonsdalea]|uniref:Phage tail protein n=3 Tax=Lonsdalea TaxID=1082702 RepID=A0ACD1JAW0_9GAMM|nr:MULTISPECIES: phage tail protein [Lonsdalea]AXW85706.1 phage tail protein [Lonsdalea britannica]OSM93890.1 phage tail protein [Lonsdalea britannica]OSM99407.1 phage tail protein [Lonsdalea populi]QPQ23725.1 phage tail protein [Lonsdalea populi]RAT10741.1 phage tail protein [Lonsdalea quercina]
MMMVLGLFVFTLKTVPYQELQRQRAWRHVTNSRIGYRPVTQYVGPDNDTITLQGVLLPQVTGGALSLWALEQMAETGKAWALLEGSGTIYGMYVIESLNETRSQFFQDGKARRIEFTLTLKRVDESLSAMLGDLSTSLGGLKDSATQAIGGLTSAVSGVLS